MTPGERATERLKMAHPGLWLEPGPIHLAKPDAEGRVRQHDRMTMCRSEWTVPPNRTLVLQYITCAICGPMALRHPEWFAEKDHMPGDTFVGRRIVLR